MESIGLFLCSQVHQLTPIVSQIYHVRFECFMAVTMKNVIFWDIRTQFVPHRKHITSPLKSQDG
jgi:hypothetical protein